MSKVKNTVYSGNKNRQLNSLLYKKYCGFLIGRRCSVLLVFYAKQHDQQHSISAGVLIQDSDRGKELLMIFCIILALHGKEEREINGRIDR